MFRGIGPDEKSRAAGKAVLRGRKFGKWTERGAPSTPRCYQPPILGSTPVWPTGKESPAGTGRVQCWEKATRTTSRDRGGRCGEHPTAQRLCRHANGLGQTNGPAQGGALGSPCGALVLGLFVPSKKTACLPGWEGSLRTDHRNSLPSLRRHDPKALWPAIGWPGGIQCGAQRPRAGLHNV